MSINSVIRPISGSDIEGVVPIRRGSLGVDVNPIELVNSVYGSEGPKDLRVTNKTENNIDLRLHGNHSRDRITLGSGLTKFFLIKPRDGLGHMKTSKYECEFWLGSDKYAKHYVYGTDVPRKDNIFEVTEEGISLVDETGKYLLVRWKTVDKN